MCVVPLIARSDPGAKMHLEGFEVTCTESNRGQYVHGA